MHFIAEEMQTLIWSNYVSHTSQTAKIIQNFTKKQCSHAKHNVNKAKEHIFFQVGHISPDLSLDDMLTSLWGHYDMSSWALILNSYWHCWWPFYLKARSKLIWHRRFWVQNTWTLHRRESPSLKDCQFRPVISLICTSLFSLFTNFIAVALTLIPYVLFYICTYICPLTLLASLCSSPLSLAHALTRQGQRG